MRSGSSPRRAPVKPHWGRNLARPHGAAYASPPAVRLDSQGLTVTHAQRSGVAATLLALAAAASAGAAPPVAQPVPARHSADASFARLEHEYVTYVLGRFPVVATYLGGAQFDAQLAEVDGRLRDYSPAALQQEDAALGALRARFAALAPARLSPRRRIDRSVALAQIAFLIHEHQVRRLQRRALDSFVDEP